MKESIGYTATLNIVIIFIVIVFTFLSAALIYYKSSKVSNIIRDAIEKHSYYNTQAINEIDNRLTSIGYNKKSIHDSCKNDVINGCEFINTTGYDGYCVYTCVEGEYYYYKIRTNMMFNVPILNEILNIPIFSNTNRLYDFEQNL